MLQVKYVFFKKILLFKIFISETDTLTHCGEGQTIIVYANVNECTSGSVTLGAEWRLVIFKNMVLLRLFKFNRYDIKLSLYKVHEICIEVAKCTHGITLLHTPLVSFIFKPGRLTVELYLSFIPTNI